MRFRRTQGVRYLFVRLSDKFIDDLLYELCATETARSLSRLILFGQAGTWF